MWYEVKEVEEKLPLMLLTKERFKINEVTCIQFKD